MRVWSLRESNPNELEEHISATCFDGYAWALDAESSYVRNPTGSIARISGSVIASRTSPNVRRQASGVRRQASRGPRASSVSPPRAVMISINTGRCFFRFTTDHPPSINPHSLVIRLGHYTVPIFLSRKHAFPPSLLHPWPCPRRHVRFSNAPTPGTRIPHGFSSSHECELHQDKQKLGF